MAEASRLRARALRLALLALAAVPGAAPQAAPPPQRIVSLNLCTDQILLQLVGRERIAALTFRAQDAGSSVLHAQARGLPVVYGNAEEVLTLKPDLVVVGTFTTRHTTAMLRRFGIPVLAIPGANSFAEVEAEIRAVARAVAEEARGEALIARFRARLAELGAGHRELRPVTAQYRPGGHSAGRATLYQDIFAAAGHDNGAARAGLHGYGILPLEKLVEQLPDFLVTSDHGGGAPTQARRLLQHPAIAGLGAREVVLPARLAVCGGPWNLDAAALLAASEARR